MVTYDRSKLPERLHEYLNYLINVKGNGQLTVENYARDLLLFFRFVCDARRLSPVVTEERNVSSIQEKSC